MRLKVVKGFAINKAKKISIPFGAIKSQVLHSAIVSIHNISIPFGAIKRFWGDKNRNIDDWISIPFGAIKRHKSSRDPSGKRRFQFLLVRLKGRPPFSNTILSPFDFNSFWCD